MTPTLSGRIQTRLFLLATVGFVWTFLVVPFLPRFGATIGEVYGIAYLSLILIGLLGVGWEALYHGIQQYRWEKDWPVLLGLVTGLPEFLFLFIALVVVLPSPPNVITALFHFSSTWTMMWLVANGPLRVVLIRWRFRGGRVL
jgi:hypothetical protein